MDTNHVNLDVDSLAMNIGMKEIQIESLKKQLQMLADENERLKKQLNSKPMKVVEKK